MKALGRTGCHLQLLLVTAVACAGTYARTAVGPFQETIRVALALDDNQMALLQGPALAFPLMIFSIPLGLMIDRYSRVRLLRILVLCSTVGSFFTALASSFVMMLFVRAFVGLMALAVPPVAISLIADIYPLDQRGRALMTMSVGQLAGVAGAFALGGKLLVQYGSGATGWHSAMLWLAVPLVPVVSLTLLMREPPRKFDIKKNAPISEAWRELWRVRATTTLLLAGIVTMELALSAVFIWTAPALSRIYVITPDQLGVTMAVAVMISGVVGPIMGGTLADVSQRSGGGHAVHCLSCLP